MDYKTQNMKNDKIINFRIPTWLNDKLDLEAKRRGITKSDLARKYMVEGLNNSCGQ